MFVVSVGCLTAAGAQQPEGDFAITDVRLFDGERVLPSATIVTRDGRIAQVSPTGLSQLPAVVIDGRGRTVLPGLIDAHVHSFDETALRDAIRFGVTTVLDMFCPVEDAAKLRALRGQPSVADYYSAGPVATAPGGHGTQYGFPTPTLSAPADADAFVAARIAEGSDYIKIIIEQVG
jgi:cytosine/adenosine deaminase-related metal-dependent hydrolase